MSRSYTPASRLLTAAACALVLCGALTAFGWGAPAGAQQNTNAAQPQPPKKKKLPPGAKGFEQYAGRDASDKLVTGGATRGEMSAYDVAMQRGRDAYEAGQYKDAVAAFKEATTLQAKSFKAFFSLGAAYEAQGLYKEATEAYKRATALTPDPVNDQPTDVLIAYYNLGNALANAGQHREAVDAYQQVISRAPTLAMPYYNMGISLASLGQQQEAIKSFQDAIKVFKDTAARVRDYHNPTYELAYYNLGVAYSKTEQYAEAAAAFQQALALDPAHAEARYNLGLVYYMTDNRPGLVEQQKALQASKPELARELAKLMSQ